jgi:hypothetical protein
VRKIIVFVLAMFLAACAGTPSAPSPRRLRITTASLPAAVLNNPYSQQLKAQGGVGPYDWSIASGSLPPGISLTSSGLISGKPASVGTYLFTIQVMDSKTSARAEIQIEWKG